MSTHRFHATSCPRSFASIRSFALTLGLVLVCLVPCDVAVAAPVETSPNPWLERSPQDTLDTSRAMDDTLDAGTSRSASKTETPPPSEEDPEVDEIDPLTGGWDYLVRRLKGLAGLIG